MTIFEAHKELTRLQSLVNADEFCEILRTNLELQYAWDFITDTGDENHEKKKRGFIVDYNTTCTGFSLRSMSAYRSKQLRLVFNPFDLRKNHEWYWLLNPWEDRFSCVRNAVVSIQKLARRFQLQQEILSLREFSSPFSLSKDCYMAILGLMDDVTEADDFLMGLYYYSELNYLTKCYLLNGYENLKAHHDQIIGSVLRLYQSLGAEFVTSSFGASEQRNHNSVPFRVLAYSSSQLKLSEEECDALVDRAKTRPNGKTMSNDITNTLNGSWMVQSPTELNDVRFCRNPREAELFMRLGESFAPELLQNLLEKLNALINNIILLKNKAETYQAMPYIYQDAFIELLECYGRSESYKVDLLNYITKPATYYTHKSKDELEQIEIDDFFFRKYRVHVINDNEVYNKCSDLLHINEGRWSHVLEFLENYEHIEEQFRMYMAYMSYQKAFIDDFIKVMEPNVTSDIPSLNNISAVITSCFVRELLNKDNPHQLFLLLLVLFARRLYKNPSTTEFVDFMSLVYPDLYKYYSEKETKDRQDIIDAINNLKKKAQNKFDIMVMDQASLLSYVDELYKPNKDGSRSKYGNEARLLAMKLFLKFENVIRE